MVITISLSSSSVALSDSSSSLMRVETAPIRAIWAEASSFRFFFSPTSLDTVLRSLRSDSTS